MYGCDNLIYIDITLRFARKTVIIYYILFYILFYLLKLFKVTECMAVIMQSAYITLPFAKKTVIDLVY